jgi:hypothetical protein
VRRMLVKFRWCRYAQPPANSLASLRLAENHRTIYPKRNSTMKCLAVYLAVLFVSFQKGDQPPNNITNWKNLLAFFLSCLTMTLMLFGIGLLGLTSKHYHPVRVQIRSSVDVHDIITAIQSVHRTDVDIKTVKDPFAANWATTILGGSIGFMVLIGFVMFIYKHICRWMGISPDI